MSALEYAAAAPRVFEDGALILKAGDWTNAPIRLLATCQKISPPKVGHAESTALRKGVINKRLYICGGLDESRQPLNSVEAFTPPGVSVQMAHCTPRERHANTVTWC
eukprot:Skav230525  [mRNA]  locus=scaffold1183:46153:48696:+ [translate_table: standard]